MHKIRPKAQNLAGLVSKHFHCCENEGRSKAKMEEVRHCAGRTLVLCLARAHLLARNGLVNKVEFLGLIPKKW